MCTRAESKSGPARDLGGRLGKKRKEEGTEDGTGQA